MIAMKRNRANASMHLEHLVHNKCVINFSYCFYYCN